MTDQTKENSTDSTQVRVDCALEVADVRKMTAKLDKQNGRHAYSDCWDHVVVNMHGSEYGFDLMCAIRLRADLDRAIHNSALSDDQYLYLCL